MWTGCVQFTVTDSTQQGLVGGRGGLVGAVGAWWGAGGGLVGAEGAQPVLVHNLAG